MHRRFSLKDRARFMKKLSFLLDSGIPFLQALHFMKDREERKMLKVCLTEVLERIHAGSPIHKSFSFPPLIIDMQSLRIIENAEMTGALAKNCQRIGHDLETKLINRNRLLSALTYPAFIFVFAIVLVLVLVIFVFPKILSILDTGQGELPISTRMLMVSSDFLKENGLMMIGVISACVAAAIFFFKRSIAFKRNVQRTLLAIPLVSKIVRLVTSHLFAKLISLFLESGYTLSESLYHAERLEHNLVYKHAFALLREGVRKGERFSRLLQAERLFPKEFSQFAALGEESGNLSKTLLHLSLLFEEELKEIEKRVFSLIEPALMLFLGLIVGFIALSLISPIYSLTSSLSQSSP